MVVVLVVLAGANAGADVKIFGKTASSMIWSRRRDDDWRRGRFRRRGPRRDVFTILRAKKEEDFVKENVDNAAKVLDSIIKETVEQIFVDEVSEEVFEEVDELSNDDDESESASKSFEREKRRRKEMEKEQMRVRILKSVVKSKFNELDGTFLSVLGAYIKQAEMKDDMPLLSLLQAIKEETLQAVTVEMQPEMQVVQLVARLMRAEDRAEVLKIAHKGGGRAKCLKVYDGVVEDPTRRRRRKGQRGRNVARRLRTKSGHRRSRKSGGTVVRRDGVERSCAVVGFVVPNYSGERIRETNVSQIGQVGRVLRDCRFGSVCAFRVAESRGGIDSETRTNRRCE